MKIIAIDPGNTESAYCLMDEEYKPLKFAKANNEDVQEYIISAAADKNIKAVVIEMIACYGMPVGREVFETCVWIGKFMQTISDYFSGVPVLRIERPKVKLNVCNSAKAKDSNIRRALIDRFAKHDLKNGKGTKKNPDFFYGFKADIWAAYAVGVTYFDERIEA